MNILILGCGQIGQALATQLSTKHHVTAVSRTAKDFVNFRHLQQDIHTLQFNHNEKFDWVYVILAPNQRDINEYQHTFIETAKPVFQALQTHPIQRIVFISSTRVYGEDQGQIVDDQTIPDTQDIFGRCLIDAEQIWQSFWQEKLIIIRPSGLYQANSTYLTRLAHQTTRIDKLHWTNRIHRSDLIGFLNKMTELNALKSSYLLSDTQPRLQHEIINLIRERDGFGTLNLEKNLPVTGKKIHANHLIASGYSLQYPDFKVQ